MPASSDIVNSSEIDQGSAPSWKVVQSGAANAGAGYNHCLRCNRKIKAPQVMGRVCLRKTKVTDARKDELASPPVNGQRSPEGREIVVVETKSCNVGE
jgi:hypothetical protein